MKQNMRIKYIDIAKGLCIVLVVISHITGIPVIGQFLFAPYVSIFYFVSGFVYKDKTLNIVSQIKRRFVSLMKYYVVYGIFIFLINIVINFVRKEITLSSIGIELLGLLYSRHSLTENGVPLMNSGNSTLWYITSALTSSTLFYLALKISKKIRKIYIIIGLSIISILFEFCPILLPWSIDIASFGTLLMLFGYWSAQKKDKIKMKIKMEYRILIFNILVFVYVILCLMNSESNISIRNYGRLPIGLDYLMFTVSSLLGCLFYIMYSRSIVNKKIGILFETIGNKSVHVLCGHLIVIRIIDSLLDYWKVSGHGLSYWILVLIKVCLSVTIPLIGEKVFGNYLAIYWKKGR